MIEQDSINTLKQSLDIVDVIGSYVTLKKNGTNYTACCPFHNEKSPSFTVSKAKNLYKCFGCGKSGDSITFVMEHENKSYIESIRILADKYNVDLDETKQLKKYEKPLPRLEKLEKKTIEYFENVRKISNNTLLRFKVTDSEEWMPKAKAVIPVICFNYYVDNELINIKFRGKNKDFMMSKNAKLVFYNLDAIKDEKEIVICEGEVDAMSFHEAGIYNVVSVPNGAGAGKLNLEYLDNCWEYFVTKERIILATDNDTAGLGLMEELARRLGKDKCSKITYPTDKVVNDVKLGDLRACKDCNEVLVHLGAESVRSLIENARGYPLEGILTVEDDLYTDIVDYWLNGFPTGVAVGIAGFDELLKFQGGQYTTITGIPGSGKSEFLDYIIARSIENHNWRWGICSFENQPSSIHATKIMQKMAGRSFAFRKDMEHRMTQDDFDRTVVDVDAHCFFLKVIDADISIEGVLEKAQQLVERKGINAFVLDPWNYIEQNRPSGVTETEHISQCLTKIRLFCSLTNVHLFLVAHPTKLKKENGKYEVPTMYNISGSAHFYNKTDNGISVYRDFTTNIVTVYVQKVRFEWNGGTGLCQFNYNKETRQYHYLPTMD